MNVFAAFLQKEWKSQRVLLASYLGLVWVSLGLVLFLFVLRDGRDASARLGTNFWCLATGLAGVLVFVAPQCVRGELGPKDDQFLRRLPGALAPAYWAKALFVLSATAAIAVLACLLAWLLQHLLGVERSLWFENEFRLLPVFLWSPVLLVPWVLAIGYWLPRGRMALGATVLLGLVLATAVWRLLAISPGLGKTLAYESLLWLNVPLALFVGYVSCVHGRRGGGALRSAKFGIAALLLGLLPHAVWFGDKFYAFHWPNPEALGLTHVHGVTPDGRYVIALASDRIAGGGQFRVDLQTGEATQLGGALSHVCPELAKTEGLVEYRPRRFWCVWPWSAASDFAMLDAETGVAHVCENKFDTHVGIVRDAIPKEVQSMVAASNAQSVELPGGRTAHLEGRELTWQRADGSTGCRTLPHADPALIGHGVEMQGSWGPQGAQHVFFDLLHERDVALGRTWLMNPAFPSTISRAGTWLVFGPGARARRIDGATDAELACALPDHVFLLGVWSEREVLLYRGAEWLHELFTYDLTTDVLTPLPWPDQANAQLRHVRLGHEARALRDPRGRMWLCCGDGEQAIVVCDPVTHTSQVVSRRKGGQLTTIGFTANAALLHEDDRRIVRIDFDTGARTILFPRRDAAAEELR